MVHNEILEQVVLGIYYGQLFHPVIRIKFLELNFFSLIYWRDYFTLILFGDLEFLNNSYGYFKPIYFCNRKQ